MSINNKINLILFVLIVTIFNVFRFNDIFACDKHKAKGFLKIKREIFQKYYTEEELSLFEKKLEIKIPKLAKEIYLGKVNINKLNFQNKYTRYEKMRMSRILSLTREFYNENTGDIKKIEELPTDLKSVLWWQSRELQSVEYNIIRARSNFEFYQVLPNETVMPFAEDDSGVGIFYIDNDDLWFFDMNDWKFICLNQIN